MSGGSNGLTPIASLQERQRCPEAPTKRKYYTAEEAWTAARERAAETSLPIAPYACSGCGHLHLTKKVNGSDVLTSEPGIVTGALRKNASRHPVFGANVSRETLPEPEGELIPGNHDARLKMARALLTESPTPTTTEIREALHCSKGTAAAVMRELGYVNTKGRTAHWRPIEANRPVDTPSVVEHWETIDADALAHIPLGDLLTAYRAVGVTIRVQVLR